MKNIFLLLCLCLSISTVSAQFGLKAGVNASNISTDNDDIDDIKSKLGFQVGALIDLPLSETIWLRPEAVYIRKGADYNLGDIEVNTEMNYIEFPITIAYHPKLLPLQFRVGPQFSYLIQTTVEYGANLPGSIIVKDTDRDNYEDFDLGMVIGAGLQLNNAFLELRYSHSLKEYEKSSEIGSISIEPSSKHFNLQMSLGYLF